MSPSPVAPRSRTPRSGLRRLVAVVRLRCPVCLDGEVFHATFHMLPACQVCGHRFEREPGFYRGATYVSYAIGLVTFVAITAAAVHWLAPKVGLWPALLVAGLCYLLLMPGTFRYTRVIWAHLDAAAAIRGARPIRSRD